jgi:hypothetical protein
VKRRVPIEVISSACRQTALAVRRQQEKQRERDERYKVTIGKSHLTLEMDAVGGVQTYSSEDGVVTKSFPADIVSPELSTKDMTVERTVDDVGNIHLNVKGWVKANVPTVVGPKPRST